MSIQPAATLRQRDPHARTRRPRPVVGLTRAGHLMVVTGADYGFPARSYHEFASETGLWSGTWADVEHDGVRFILGTDLDWIDPHTPPPTSRYSGIPLDEIAHAIDTERIPPMSAHLARIVAEYLTQTLGYTFENGRLFFRW